MIMAKLPNDAGMAMILADWSLGVTPHDVRVALVAARAPRSVCAELLHIDAVPKAAYLVFL